MQGMEEFTLGYISAKYNIKFNIQRIYGVDNIRADILSRWYAYKYSNIQEAQYLKECSWINVNDMLWSDFLKVPSKN